MPCLTWTTGPQVLAPGGRGRGPAFCPAPAVRLSRLRAAGLPSPPCEGSGHFLLCSVSWNFVLVYRRWKPFLVMVSSEWNFTRTESPAEYTSSGG